ncbi:MAG: hypothetical protein Q9185_002135 [Variospora sp. 1 TL-2023]
MDNPNHDPALQQTSLHSGQDDDKDIATKRKRKDVTNRTKRNRYISIACTGFKDSGEYQAMNQTIQGLQDQVQRLYADLSAVRNPSDSSTSPYPNPSSYPQQPSLLQTQPDGPYHATQPPAAPSRVRHRRFQGPTSSAFSIDVANSSLQTMGLAATSLTEVEGHDYEELASTTPQQRQASDVSPGFIKDPIWSIGKEEAIRLCRVYEEEIGIMYPMLDIEHVIDHSVKMFTSAPAATEPRSVDRPQLNASGLDNSDCDVLSMVLATALFLEGGGQSELGSILFDAVRPACESKLGEPPDIGGLRLLVIMAQCRFMQGAEVQAYRTIGLAARLGFEIGLHRNHVLHRDFANDRERTWALKLFWSIFVLDRRWSFGTAYSRIASKVWRSITAPNAAGSEVQEDTMSYLDYQVLQWQNTIPDSLRFYPTVDVPDTGPPSRAQRRLQVLLYLRMNQMRILIYRPVLHSATSIMGNRRYANVVVEVAKDTIRVLSRLNQTTDIYRAQQVCFNHFLVSALAALFLAVSHAPVEFNQTVRDEFYKAIDLVRGFSAQSYVSMRLWQTIKGLKDIGPRLGLVSRQTLTDDIDPHSSAAAVAMAGLAGHRVTEMTAFPTTQGPAAVNQTPVDGQQMSYELISLFEAAGGYHNAIVPSHNLGIHYGHGGYVAAQGEAKQPSAADGARGGSGNEREFSKIMRALY